MGIADSDKTDARMMEDIYLKSIENDLEKFNVLNINYLSAEYHPKQEAKLPAKYHVVIHNSFDGTPKGKNIINSLEYFAPALNAYACFKASKVEVNKDAARCFFDAGISYFIEWHARKESVISYLAFMRGNTDESIQLKIINKKLTDSSVTGYALERDNIAPKKTAEKVIKQLNKFLNHE